MAIRIQNLPEKSFNEGRPALSMPSLSVNYPSWWVLNEHPIPLSLSSSVSLKAESLRNKENDETKKSGLQLVDQDSSSTQSITRSHSGGINSPDQSNSSESGQDDSCGKSVKGQMKPGSLYNSNSSEITFDPSHADHIHKMIHVACPPADPYFAGLMTAYGQQAIMQPQMGPQAIGMAPPRVPLPHNLPEDGPIFVNAKQYHGILRRRQSRAKLEAQNKLVKARKPYLHESRHLHALNRVRGSGGRFLSTKKLHRANSHEDQSGQNRNCTRGNGRFDPPTTSSETTSTSNRDVFFRRPDRGLTGISGPVMVQRNGGPLLDTSGLRSSSVR